MGLRSAPTLTRFHVIANGRFQTYELKCNTACLPRSTANYTMNLLSRDTWTRTTVRRRIHISVEHSSSVRHTDVACSDKHNGAVYASGEMKRIGGEARRTAPPRDGTRQLFYAESQSPFAELAELVPDHIYGNVPCACSAELSLRTSVMTTRGSRMTWTTLTTKSTKSNT